MSLAVPIIEQTIAQEMGEIMDLLHGIEKQKLEKSSEKLVKILALRLRPEDSDCLEAGAHFLNKWLKTVPHLNEASRVFLAHAILRRLGARLNLV